MGCVLYFEMGVYFGNPAILYGFKKAEIADCTSFFFFNWHCTLTKLTFNCVLITSLRFSVIRHSCVHLGFVLFLFVYFDLGLFPPFLHYSGGHGMCLWPHWEWKCRPWSLSCKLMRTYPSGHLLILPCLISHCLNWWLLKVLASVAQSFASFFFSMQMWKTCIQHSEKVRKVSDNEGFLNYSWTKRIWPIMYLQWKVMWKYKLRHTLVSVSSRNIFLTSFSCSGKRARFQIQHLECHAKFGRKIIKTEIEFDVLREVILSHWKPVSRNIHPPTNLKVLGFVHCSATDAFK